MCTLYTQCQNKTNSFDETRTCVNDIFYAKNDLHSVIPIPYLFQMRQCNLNGEKF